MIFAIAVVLGTWAPWREQLVAPTTISGDSLFPAETAQDWISYADAIAYVEVTREEEGFQSDPIAEGEGYFVNRSVELTVMDVVWDSPLDTRPDLKSNELVRMAAPGWWVTDRGRSPLVLEGGERLELGDSYLAALLYDDRGSIGGEVGWTLLAPTAAVRVERDAELVSIPGVGEVKQQELVAVLAGLAVPDHVTAFLNLHPVDRLVEGSRALHGAEQPERDEVTESVPQGSSAPTVDESSEEGQAGG
jgi:hypothetical protein